MQRIGDIGWKIEPTLPHRAAKASIVKIHPNRYFGTKDSYIASGWKETAKVLSYKGEKLPLSAFKEKEATYHLASVQLYPTAISTKITVSEDHLLYISDSDRRDFFLAYRAADAALRNEEYAPKNSAQSA